MDWFSWLSKTNLEPSLVYEYGLEFSRNDLQAEDIIFFNHEFLQSMGISVAKHRLEILKVAKKELGPGEVNLSSLTWAISKIKKGLKKCITKTKWVFLPQVSSIKALPEPAQYGEKWRGALTMKSSTEKHVKAERPPTPMPMLKVRREAKSGPLDRRMMQEKLMIPDRSLKLSGPIDVRENERLLLGYNGPKLYGMPNGKTQQSLVICRRSPQVGRPLHGSPLSPKVYGELETKKREVVNGDSEDHLLWATLFQHIEPT